MPPPLTDGARGMAYAQLAGILEAELRRFAQDVGEAVDDIPTDAAPVRARLLALAERAADTVTHARTAAFRDARALR